MLGGAVVLVVGALAVLVVEALLARRGEVPPFANPSRAPLGFGAPDAAPLRLVVLGDSTGAGQGAPYADGIAVFCARELARGGRRVSLVNRSVSGATTADVRREQLAPAAAFGADVALIAAGANDVTALRRTGAVTRDVRRIVSGLRGGNPDVRIVLTGAPDVGSSPRLAQPLRAVARLRVRRLNAAIERLARSDGLGFAPIAERTGPRFTEDRSLFSPDRYHPNARGYATWRAPLADALRETGSR